MTVEPRNAASDKSRADFPKFGDRHFVETELLGTLADDFVREDRRRLIDFATATGEELVAYALSWFDVGDGQPKFSTIGTVAVRGERLALVHWRVGYEDGMGTELLAVGQYDERVQITQRVIAFDLEDINAAIVELDRMHAEIEAAST